MAHALNLEQTFVERGVDIFASDINNMLNRNQALKAHSTNEISGRVVRKAITNLGLHSDEWKNLSKYAKESIGEAFAEALSDDSNQKLSKEIKEIVKGGFK